LPVRSGGWFSQFAQRLSIFVDGVAGVDHHHRQWIRFSAL